MNFSLYRHLMGGVRYSSPCLRFRSLVSVIKISAFRFHPLTRPSSLRLRGYLTVYVNLCWAIGQLIAAGVLRGFANDTTQWAYRIPFGIQWAWPIPLFAILWFAPESPWWLVRKGRKQEALVSIQRLSSTRSAASPESTLALIEHTNAIESEDVASQHSASYLDCFRGIDLRRTEIACMAFAAQIWCGSPLGGTPVYFFVQAGLSSSNAFSFNVGGLGIAALGTILSWGLLSRFGRRTLYLWGLGGLSLCLYIVGIMSAVSNAPASSFAQAGMIIVWLAIYYLTVGPICYAIISEVSAVRLRNQTICLARMTYYIFQVTGNIIHPYMVNPTEANWKGKADFSGAARVRYSSSGLFSGCQSQRTGLSKRWISFSKNALALGSSSTLLWIHMLPRASGQRLRSEMSMMS